MTKRNYLLELWRFFFCIAVLGLHFFSKVNIPLFDVGYLGVEFFFVVAGYFVGAYYVKKMQNLPLLQQVKAVGGYAVSRLKRLYPYYFFALLLMLFVRILTRQYGIGQVPSILKKCYAEFFMLQWTPIGNEVLISAGWFVPSVFFAGLFYVALFTVCKKWTGYLIAPVCFLGIYGYYYRLIGKIDVIFSYHSVLRGIAGVGLGIFVFFLCEKLRNVVKERSWYPKLAIIIITILFFGVFIYTNFGRRSKWDFLVIALYGIGVLLLMAADVKGNEKVEKIVGLLGKSTYPIYIFQMPVIECILFLIER